MEIYSIKEAYINYLRKFDDKVCDHKSDSQFGRKYTGIVITIKNQLYFAPLTSSVTTKDRKTGKVIFKKHFTDVYLFNRNNSPLGAVKLNNMIPVPKEAIDSLIKLEEIDLYLSSNKLSDVNYGKCSKITKKIIKFWFYKKSNNF